jgi:hypothetical protein
VAEGGKVESVCVGRICRRRDPPFSAEGGLRLRLTRPTTAFNARRRWGRRS